MSLPYGVRWGQHSSWSAQSANEWTYVPRKLSVFYFFFLPTDRNTPTVDKIYDPLSSHYFPRYSIRINGRIYINPCVCRKVSRNGTARRQIRKYRVKDEFIREQSSRIVMNLNSAKHHFRPIPFLSDLPIFPLPV